MESFFSSLFFLLFFHSSWYTSIILSSLPEFLLFPLQRDNISSSFTSPSSFLVSLSARLARSLFLLQTELYVLFLFLAFFFSFCFCVVPRWLVEVEAVSFRCDGSVHAASTPRLFYLPLPQTHTYTPLEQCAFWLLLEISCIIILTARWLD